MSSARRGWLTVWRAFATAISLILNGPASVSATDGAVRRLEGGLQFGGAAKSVVGLPYLEAFQMRRNRDHLVSAMPPSAGARDRVSQSPSEPTPAHHFFCNTGYRQPDCDLQAKRLSDVLAGLDLAPLGEWTWVLVQSQDWKPILRRAGRDPDSPAFTILDKRQTFLEEALFRPNVDRSRILLEKYRVPLDRLLYLAITHELGHAICHEVDELKAIAYANQLRNAGRVLCGQPVPPPQCRDSTRDAANSGRIWGHRLRPSWPARATGCCRSA